MDEDKRIAKVQYNAERQKELYESGMIKKFVTVMSSEEFNEIDKFLKKHNLNKIDLVRYGFKMIKTEYLDK